MGGRTVKQPAPVIYTDFEDPTQKILRKLKMCFCPLKRLYFIIVIIFITVAGTCLPKSSVVFTVVEISVWFYLLLIIYI